MRDQAPSKESMTNTRHNRLYISTLAIEFLTPMVKKVGELHFGNGIEPSYRDLTIHGLKIMLIENHLEKSKGSIRFVLNIWEPGRGKVFAASWAPLEIIGFRSGTWIETVIEMSLQSEFSAKVPGDGLHNTRDSRD